MEPPCIGNHSEYPPGSRTPPDTHTLRVSGVNDPLLTWRDNGFYDEAGALSYLTVQAAVVDSQDNDIWLDTTHRAGYKFVSFAIARSFFLPTPIVSCLAFQ